MVGGEPDGRGGVAFGGRSGRGSLCVWVALPIVCCVLALLTQQASVVAAMPSARVRITEVSVWCRSGGWVSSGGEAIAESGRLVMAARIRVAFRDALSRLCQRSSLLRGPFP